MSKSPIHCPATIHLAKRLLEHDQWACCVDANTCLGKFTQSFSHIKRWPTVCQSPGEWVVCVGPPPAHKWPIEKSVNHAYRKDWNDTDDWQSNNESKCCFADGPPPNGVLFGWVVVVVKNFLNRPDASRIQRTQLVWSVQLQSIRIYRHVTNRKMLDGFQPTFRVGVMTECP